ncbi:transcriptional regulator [Streptomyces camponoticapitis]|uniref:Transcriptional regulator n=1 Tax=Streptomyces camponoticapitis TaxID=1616125 RepID=A0ABQ2E4F3_9ACTN|nr:helix-turn-helix transcriptional regulator [Streptomyces camponoticapitis]GGJ95336.1 transcriptional regulator [Streptomyces camponoticapitis]
MATTEARAFAELLSELKDRSGRSYGVLAAKLHVSTSTLHRYCNGDAVPADFSAAERFGRLCGATGEEFVELHRRWILADEARRRSRAAVPSAPAEAVAAVPEAPEAEPAAPAGAPAPETGTPEGDASASGRGKRLYITLAAAAVVVAVAVPALVFGPLNDPSTGRSSVASEVSEGGSSKSAPPSASPSGSPSAGKSPSPDASPTARETPKGKKGGGDAGNGEGERAVGGVPVTVSTKPYAFEDPCTQRYLVDRPATEVPPPPNEPDAPGWVAALGAVSSGSQFIELAIQGTGSETVVLNRLNVRVVGSEAPLAWNDFGTGVGCGGGVTTRTFGVDLDAGRPSVVTKGGQRDFPYKVSESDPEVFHITANASARYVSWYLELEWSSGGREGTVRIDDRGKPFRTSGAKGRPSFEYPLGGAAKWETAVEQDPNEYP